MESTNLPSWVALEQRSSASLRKLAIPTESTQDIEMLELTRRSATRAVFGNL